MIRAHKIRLNPTPEQENYFYKAAGTARFAYNWAVNEWGTSEGKMPGAAVLKKQFNAQKPDWAYDVPKLGLVNMAEKLRLHGKIMGARVVKTGNHWYAAISVEIPAKQVVPKAEAVGVDVGILRLATLSDGKVFDNERPLRNNLERLAQLQRILARKVKGSRNYEKIKAKIRQLHARIRHIRDDILHKMTTFIAKKYGFVATEDLYVKGMTKNHRLALSLQDAALGRLLTFLQNKVEDRNGVLVKVGRFFASSKSCSNPECDGCRDDLTLADRVFVCAKCGLCLDRDLNASINILYEGLRLIFNYNPSGSGYDGRKTPLRRGTT